MPSFAAALQAVNRLKADGVVEDYAIAETMALVFWTEPVATYDLDVLVLLPGPETPLVSLDAIYRWAASQGYPTRDEHILVDGLPVQLVPSPNALSSEAIRAATRSHKRRERAAALLDLPGLNRALLDEIPNRHGLRF